MSIRGFRPHTLVVAAATAILSLTGAGCAVTRHQESVGAYIDDATLTARVKAKFADDATVSAMAIGVETLNGTVHLSGFAKSQLEKDTAGRLARDTSGVVNVRNDIIVRA